MGAQGGRGGWGAAGPTPHAIRHTKCRCGGPAWKCPPQARELSHVLCLFTRGLSQCPRMPPGPGVPSSVPVPVAGVDPDPNTHRTAPRRVGPRVRAGGVADVRVRRPLPGPSPQAPTRAQGTGGEGRRQAGWGGARAEGRGWDLTDRAPHTGHGGLGGGTSGDRFGGLHSVHGWPCAAGACTRAEGWRPHRTCPIFGIGDGSRCKELGQWCRSQSTG